MTDINPAYIVFSSADVEKVGMLQNDNAWTGNETHAGNETFSGDIYSVGEGSGLPYGSCSSGGTDINWTQASAAQNTFYDISDADMVDGELHLVTHDGNGLLTVTVAGRYLINHTLVAETTGANKHVGSAISISGTEHANGRGYAEFVTANAEREIVGTGIYDLAANATINVSIRTTDTGTPTLTVHRLNITLIQVGGT